MTLIRCILSFAMCAAIAHADDTRTAQTITGDSLLQVPAGLADKASKEFTVARAAPTLDVIIIDKLPDKGPQTLWSTWGDGCIAASGKYYTSIGDHMGVDGTAHVYEYDPATKQLKMVVDVFRDLNIKPGTYGHGKIHSGIHEAKDGWLYFSTYWGKHREIEQHFGKAPGNFEGSLLLRYHPATKKLENLGAIAPRQGLPASAFDEGKGLLCFYAVYQNDVCVYDVNTKQRVFHGGGDAVAGSRTFMRDRAARFYFTGKDGFVHYYDPEKRALVATTAKLPTSEGDKKKDDTLRASAPRPTKAGNIYGMTAPGRMFEFNPGTLKVRDLGANFMAGHYTASMAISPDDRFLYYVPGAHGSSGSVGTPVVQFEIATGQRKVLAFLSSPLREKLAYHTGGTYNLQLDAKGETIYITFNGQSAESAAKKASGFGLPSVVVLKIPASER